jgi:hypothetical protein
MARKAKPIRVPTKFGFDARLIEAGIEKESLEKLMSLGFTWIFLYETSGLLLDKWTPAYCAAYDSEQDKYKDDFDKAIVAGRARNVQKIKLEQVTE